MRWESDDFPGWIEVSVRDADGRDHLIVDKAPILTNVAVTSASRFPFEVWVDADLEGVSGNEAIVTLGQGVETCAGVRVLSVATADVDGL